MRRLDCWVLWGSLGCSWEGFVHDCALLGASLQGSGSAQALENRIEAASSAAGLGIYTTPMVFEGFSAIAKAVEGRPLMSLQMPWDVLGVPGEALGGAAGRPWSTTEILVSSWNHLGEIGRVPWEPFGSACGTLAMLEINAKP